MSPKKMFALLVVVLTVSAGAWPAGQLVQNSAAPQAPGTGFIAGQVLDSTSGRPIGEATVTLIRLSVVIGPAGRGAVSSGPSTVVTDGQGRYFFTGLSAGAYTVRAERPGYTAARTVPSPIDLADGGRVMDSRARLVPIASVAGTVRDTAGDPVVGTEVLAFRRTIINGRSGLQSVLRGVKSDDRGAYRLSGLTPGDYLVCACLRDPNPFDGLLLTTLASEPVNLMSVAARALTVGADVVSLDDTLRAYAPTFHPNSRSAARAARVTLSPGDEKTGVDISVELVRATRVSGRVVGAQSPVQASSIRLVPAVDADMGIEITQLQPMLVQGDGRFDFATVPPGQYRLMVTHRETGARVGGPSGIALGFAGGRAASPPSAPVAIAGPGVTPPPVLWANELVAVGEAGINGLVVTLNQTAVVTGRMQFIGSSPPPTEQVLTRSSLVLQPVVIPTGVSYSPAIGPVSANATFRVIGAAPGKYTVSFASSPWVLKSVTLAGADLTDLPIEVGEKDLAELVLTLADTPLASLVVSAPPPPGQRPDDEAVLVFPTDKKYWSEPVAARRRFRTAPLSSKGTATAADLPAGEYFVVLAAGQEALDWQEPSKLDALSRRAQRVTLTDGTKQMIEVRR